MKVIKSENIFFFFFLLFTTFLCSFPLFYEQINLLEKATATRSSCMQHRTNQNKGNIKGEVTILSNNVKIKNKDNN